MRCLFTAGNGRWPFIGPEVRAFACNREGSKIDFWIQLVNFADFNVESVIHLVLKLQ